MSQAEQAASAALFAALGDPTRLTLLGKLGDGGEHSLTALAGETSLTRQAIAKHLDVLARAGLVGSGRSGRERRYTLHPATLDEARAWLAELSARWDGRIERLRAAIEE